MQTYLRQCKQAVRILNNRGIDCALDSGNGKYRLTNAKGDVNISPCYPAKMLSVWLDGFLCQTR